MMKVVNSEEIKAIDNTSIKKFNIPSIVLMENAALSAIRFIEEEILEKFKVDSILILCGNGNNGGDGLAVARHLINRKYNVTVLLVGSKKKLSADASTNFNILKKLSRNCSNLRILSFNKSKIKFKDFDLIIDAILGTGLNSEIKEPIEGIINSANNSRAIKISIDIPTGLSANNGNILGCCFKADFTLTMGLPKIGQLINSGPKVCGKLITLDISFPNHLTESEKIKNNLVQIEDVKFLLPKRDYNSHKYNVGKVLVIAGSKGFAGAAVLACESAMLTGSGGVILLSPDNLYDIYAKKLKEVVIKPLGTKDFLSIDDFYILSPLINWADVLLMGPGLGKNPKTAELVTKILKVFPQKRKLLDADALNILSEVNETNKLNLINCILTPHIGEFSRLIKKDISYIKNNLLKSGKEYAIKNNCTLILKGAPTLTFDNIGNCYINSTGNEGMATMGMGDVLTGIVSSFLSQKMNFVEAAISGVFIHGLAGDIVKIKKNVYSLLAGDVVREISNALKITLNSE